jgi:hypothetical protein
VFLFLRSFVTFCLNVSHKQSNKTNKQTNKNKQPNNNNNAHMQLVVAQPDRYAVGVQLSTPSTFAGDMKVVC